MVGSAVRLPKCGDDIFERCFARSTDFKFREMRGFRSTRRRCNSGQPQCLPCRFRSRMLIGAVCVISHVRRSGVRHGAGSACEACLARAV